MTRKITIDPVTRVEGHGKVTIHLDEDGNFMQSRLHIVEFRGFERFVKGRPCWEAPVLVQRLCGICPVSHHLAAAKAIDMIEGIRPGELPVTAEKMRRLMHYGQFFQSHSLHFFHLVSPDLLFGIDADPAKRNVVGVAKEFKDLAYQGVMMRKFGQEIIRVTAGKKIHGTGAIPGGINKNLTQEERDFFLKGNPDLHPDKMVEWATGALQLFKNYHRENKTFIDEFAATETNHLSIVREDGALDFYNGNLRAINSRGEILLNDVDPLDYHKVIGEEVRRWSYMKFPFLRQLGPGKGSYRVGPLARLNVARFIPTPLAQKELEEFRAYTDGKPNNMTMHTHWARLIELLHASEVIRDLLSDPDLSGNELKRTGERHLEGAGIIEAPRGTLIHHYRINENELITMANLIVSTTHNNDPMNFAVESVVRSHIVGHKEVTEPMLNAVEVAIRAYDPCLSCATHALGKMPLEVRIYDSSDRLLDSKFRGEPTTGSCATTDPLS